MHKRGIPARMELLGKIIKTAIKREIREFTKPQKSARPSRSTRRSRVPDLPPEWISPGHAHRIHGFDVLDGMYYLGTASTRSDPCVIDPTLPIDLGGAGSAKQSRSTNWRTFTPRKRAQYLDWLSTGRRYESAPPEFITFYLMGLERFALIELGTEAPWQRELDAVAAEARALLKTYRSVSKLERQLSAFIDYLDFRKKASLPNAQLPPPRLTRDRSLVPGYVRLELAEIAATGQPMPGDRALAWAWFLPATKITSAISSGHRFFILLFLLRYEQQWPTGIPVPVGNTPVAITYKPVNSRIRDFSLRHPTLKDVFDLPQPSEALSTLVARVSEELEPWSRWVKRNAERRDDLAGLALLPWELLSTSPGKIESLNAWVKTTFGGSDMVSTSINPLLEMWGDDALTKKESEQLARLLGHCDLGIEPDPRFGGTAYSRNDVVVLFQNPIPNSPEYQVATIFALAASAIANVPDADLEPMCDRIAKLVPVKPEELPRLRAYLRWLTTADIKVSSLKSRVESLPETLRQTIGDFAINLSVEDGAPSPTEIRTLTSIYRALGLDPEQVTHRTFRAVSTRLELQPVTLDETPVAVNVEPEFALDVEIIQRKIDETAAVNTLLGDIFDDEPATPAPLPEPASADGVATLDAAHSALVRELIAQTSWSRDAFEQLAAKHKLLPNGALATINEVAYELANEPLLDGDDPITINSYALEAFPV